MRSDELAREVKRWRVVHERSRPSSQEVEAAFRRYQSHRAQAPSAALGWFSNLALGFGAAVVVLSGAEALHSAVDKGLLARTLPGENISEHTGENTGKNAVEAAAPGASMAAEAKRGTGEPNVAVAGAGERVDQGALVPKVSPAHGLAFLEQGGVRAEIEPGVQYEVRAGETLKVVLGHEEHHVHGPRWLEFQLAPEQVSGYRLELLPEGARNSNRARAAGTAGRHSPSERTAPTERPRLWAEVVDALRSGRTDDAEAALTRLSRQGDSAARDAAALALAQIWHAKGDSRAHKALVRLSSGGATDLTRRRANDLLVESKSPDSVVP